MILVTGATGYIGHSLVESLSITSRDIVRAVVRRTDISFPGNVEISQIKDFTSDMSWRETLTNVDCIIHAAGRAHVSGDKDSSLSLFRKINVDITLNLARQAANQGVRRFIFISSIGVNGSKTLLTPFNEESVPDPHADYAVSKLEAEEGLKEICVETGMEYVIVRPPLVYGSDAPGNFKRLLMLVNMGFPLPFAKIKNMRSMIALENLIDFINVCILHPQAANQSFLVADGEDLSTAQIIHLLSEGMGKSIYLFPFPACFLEMLSSFSGKKNMYQQLCGNLQINIGKSRDLLGWVPPVSISDALPAAARKYLEMHKRRKYL